MYTREPGNQCQTVVEEIQDSKSQIPHFKPAQARIELNPDKRVNHLLNVSRLLSQTLFQLLPQRRELLEVTVERSHIVRENERVQGRVSQDLRNRLEYLLSHKTTTHKVVKTVQVRLIGLIESRVPEEHLRLSDDLLHQRPQQRVVVVFVEVLTHLVRLELHVPLYLLPHLPTVNFEVSHLHTPHHLHHPPRVHLPPQLLHSVQDLTQSVQVLTHLLGFQLFALRDTARRLLVDLTESLLVPFNQILSEKQYYLLLYLAHLQPVRRQPHKHLDLSLQPIPQQPPLLPHLQLPPRLLQKHLQHVPLVLNLRLTAEFDQLVELSQLPQVHLLLHSHQLLGLQPLLH